MKIAILFALMTGILIGHANGSEWTVRGFYPVNVFLELKRTSQESYTVGIVDGLLIADSLGAPPEKVRELATCIDNLADASWRVILQNYVIVHPETKREFANETMLEAIREQCRCHIPGTET